MFEKLNRRLFVVALATCAASSACPNVRAEQPQPVIRTFGFYVPAAFDPVIPDFLSDDSLSVSVLPMSNDGEPLILFGPDVGASGYPEESIWVPQSARHSTISGTSFEGEFYWLITEDTPTPPPVGSHTFTGSDSPWVLLPQEVFYVRACGPTDCGLGNEGELRLVDYHLSPTGPYFVVVTAWFSR